MIITVLGANGKTGQEIVNQALQAGHTVHALVRRADAITERPNLKIFVGDAAKTKDIVRASDGTSTIISALGAMSGTLMTDAITAVIAASKTTGTKRFILMSSFAVRKEQLGSGTKLLTGLLMSKAVGDKSNSEELLRTSDLDWTIVYPTALTSSPAGAAIRIVADNEKLGMKNKIARADVAKWILNESQNNAFVRKDAVITN
jgi:uncharacterized protein YbjT (DUF2867 family)